MQYPIDVIDFLSTINVKKILHRKKRHSNDVSKFKEIIKNYPQILDILCESDKLVIIMKLDLALRYDKLANQLGYSIESIRIKSLLAMNKITKHFNKLKQMQSTTLVPFPQSSDTEAHLLRK